jgi:hypothetical protein
MERWLDSRNGNPLCVVLVLILYGLVRDCSGLALSETVRRPIVPLVAICCPLRASVLSPHKSPRIGLNIVGQ